MINFTTKRYINSKNKKKIYIFKCLKKKSHNSRPYFENLCFPVGGLTFANWTVSLLACGF